MQKSIEKEKAMADDTTQTLMDYLNPTLGETNTIQLTDLPEEVTFELEHGFL